MTNVGATRPRALRSRSTADQPSVDSRCPGTSATSSFRPSLKAANTTSTAAFSFSRPAFTYTPSTHR